MYLLDTNILIYSLKGEEKTNALIGDVGVENLAISIVSRLEFLLGIEKNTFPLRAAEEYLDRFENVILDKEIVRSAANFAATCKEKLKFKDLIIAATAISRQKTLITADKDFLKLPGLKVKFLKI